MEKFVCPKCRGSLSRQGNSLVCENKHNYDISKSGYVNLLLSQKSSKKRHGDDKLMLNSRRDFLDKGYYKPLLDGLTAIISDKATDSRTTILDLGCGEGYYTSNIKKSIPNADIYGIDISKDALICAARRDKSLNLATASCSDIPMADNSCDIILNVFAPINTEECSRILTENGIFIKVIPLEMHLFSLKASIYDKPYKNKPESNLIVGFDIVDYKEIKYRLTLDNNDDIVSLFKMTPYYYKTSRHDQTKLAELSHLETEIEFGIVVYKLSAV